MTLSPPGQPTQTGRHLAVSIKGNTGVSAQRLFLGTGNTVSRDLTSASATSLNFQVYVVGKTYGNPMTIGTHSASASEVTLIIEHTRALDVKTNAYANRTTLAMVEQSTLEAIKL
ncbi:hypothetical protein DL93DRAFT_2233782 [Clavulina sp. PMI_390]|nr:hypothetical protein DL93DRAFT_2233782 [Clavulina sp. PMI_390]